ncbi:hypothetical protein V1281_000189 [Nitrobacteraceae bacterium AZCC 2161]
MPIFPLCQSYVWPIYSTMAHEQNHAIDARLEEINQQMALLQKEADELLTAKRVLERFSNGANVSATASAAQPNKGQPRPDGTPTNFEMVEAVLQAAERDGKDGLTAADIVKAIEARFWPGLVGDQILPSIYGFAKNDRLKKTQSGKIKRVKKTNEAVTE